MRKFSTYSNLFVLFILSTMVLSCSKTMSEQEIVNCGLVIHGSVWTIDTHCDTPMDMVRDEFDPGVRHDIPGISSSKVDFPGMIQGGLDAQFFACYVPQRERNKLGYINAKAIVDQAINAVEASCNKYVNLAEIAFTPQDPVRLEKMGLLWARTRIWSLIFIIVAFAISHYATAVTMIFVIHPQMKVDLNGTVSVHLERKSSRR